MTKLFKGRDNQLSKGLASTFIKVFGAIVNYALSYFIAIRFGASGNGVFALFLTYIIILSTFFYLGLDVFLVKEVSRLIKESLGGRLRKLYSNIIINYIIPLTIFLCIMGIVLNLFVKSSIIIAVVVGLILNIITDINSAIFRGLKLAELYSFFTQFLKYFITLIVVLLPIFGGFESQIVLYIYLFSLFISALFSSALVLKKIGAFKEDNSGFVKTYSLRYLFANSKDYLFSSILIITLLWIDFIFIDIFLDKSQAGIYSIALKLSSLVTFGFLAFNAFLAPRISEVYLENDKKKLQRIVSQNFVMVLPMISIPFLILIIFSKDLLSFFGEEFISGWVVLLLLSSAQFLNSILGPVSLLLQMTIFQKVFQKILIVSFIVKLITSFLLINIWGINGIAFASFIAIGLWSIIGSYFVYKKIGIYSWFSVNDIKEISMKLVNKK